MSGVDDRGALEGAVRAYLAALDRLDLEATVACFAAGASFHIDGDGVHLEGRDEIGSMWDGILGAHRQMSHELLDVIVDAERGRVATRQSFRGWEADGGQTERTSAYFFVLDDSRCFTEVRVWIDGSTPGT